MIATSGRYLPGFEAGKIVYGHFQDSPIHSFERTGALSNNKTYFVPTDDKSLLAFLNSKLAWFCFTSRTTAVRGGFFEATAQHMETLPIAKATDMQRAELGSLAEAAQAAAERRYELQQAITRRIPDLATDAAKAKPTSKLKEWWNLPDFAAFQNEVAKALKARIPLQERNDWENWIATSRAEIHALTAEIARLEAEINAKVYSLFDLNPEEITLLEANV